MSDAARSVVLDYLLAHGWSQEDSGPSGEMWTRGDAVTLIPRALEVDSSPWTRLAVTLAQVENESSEDVLLDWRNRLFHSLELRQASAPNVRPVRGRVEMEVHLDGPSVRDHETSAFGFGAFVMRTAESVKELVKSDKGLRHHSRNLLVAGGVEPGSVLVTFREPDRSDHTAMITDPPETAEGVALAFLAALWSAAEEVSGSPDTEELRARLAPLSVRARQSVARVADTVLDEGWTISGTIRRGSEEAALHLGLSGSLVLSKIAREGSEEETVESVLGTLDGWVWSKAELTLITDDRGTIRVSVPMRLQGLVGELHATPGTRVVARLAVFSRIARGTQGTLYRAYSLDGIQAEPQTALTD